MGWCTAIHANAPGVPMPCSDRRFDAVSVCMWRPSLGVESLWTETNFTVQGMDGRYTLFAAPAALCVNLLAASGSSSSTLLSDRSADAVRQNVCACARVPHDQAIYTKAGRLCCSVFGPASGRRTGDAELRLNSTDFCVEHFPTGSFYSSWNLLQAGAQQSQNVAHSVYGGIERQVGYLRHLASLGLTRPHHTAAMHTTSC